MDPAEKRRHARLEVDIPCRLVTSLDLLEGRLATLSLGGAGVAAPAGAAVGEVITLDIDWPESSDTLTLTGEVVRAAPGPDGSLYGIRFASLPPQTETALRELLKWLAAARGAGRRVHPRVQRRLVVSFGNSGEFQALMADLSRGGISLTTPDPVEVGAEISLSIGSAGMPGLLELRGVVVHTSPEGAGVRVGVQFQAVTPELEQRLQGLIGILLSLGPRTAP